jgi:hypothetical protein
MRKGCAPERKNCAFPGQDGPLRTAEQPPCQLVRWQHSAELHAALDPSSSARATLTILNSHRRLSAIGGFREGGSDFGALSEGLVDNAVAFGEFEEL